MPFDATDTGLIVDELLKAGTPDANIAKVIGGNAFRVLLEVLPQ